MADNKIDFKNQRWFWLVWILLLHFSGLYLFTSGFFLTRFEVVNISSCSEIPVNPLHAGNLRAINEDRSSEDFCWYEKKYNRILFVVIDALRYDFAKFDPTITKGGQSEYYLNHLPVLSDMLTRKPNNSLLYKFQADPPTLTMQRLKGITTGNLPTFLDFKENLHSSEIIEDNIIKQMHLRNKTIVFMGDNTWDSLYSNYFTRNYSYDSFNVKDLHTVDNGVIQHLFPEIKRKDWDLIIAHFLGVDHVGHTFGPSDFHMKEKLNEMNQVLDRIFKSVDNETLVVVMGDHGMSWDGNHGGASDDETGAALFLYSQKPLHMNGEESYENWENGFYQTNKIDDVVIPQVDLVPTLSLLLGIPIPFGNLGSVIPSLFFTSKENYNPELNILQRFKSLNRALYLNVQQIRRYFQAYTTLARIPPSSFKHLELEYEYIQVTWKELESLSDFNKNPKELIKLQALFSRRLRSYLRASLELGRKMWTQFDLLRIFWGIALLALGFVAIILHLLAKETSLSIILYGLLGGSVISFIIPIFDFFSIFPICSLSRTLLVSNLFSVVSFLYFNIRKLKIISLRNSIKSSFMLFPFLTCASISTVIFHAFALLSNSYIVAEDHVFLYLSITCTLAIYFECLYSQVSFFTSSMTSAFSLFSLRWIKYFPPNIINTSVTIHQTLIPLFLIAVLILYFNSKLHKLYSNFIFVINYILLLLYWSFDLSNSTALRLWIPRSMYIFSLFGTIHLLQTFFHNTTKNQFNELLNTLLSLIYYISLIYLLVLGTQSPNFLLCMIIQYGSFLFNIRNISIKKKKDIPLIPLSFIWSIYSSFSFYSSGHHNYFTSLQNASAFVGFDDFSYFIAGILLILNTWGSQILAIIGLPLLLIFSQNLNLKRTRTRAADISSFRYQTVVCSVIAYYSINLLITTTFVAIQRRHLMVWAIFSPKYIFDAFTFIVVITSLLLYSFFYGTLEF